MPETTFTFRLDEELKSAFSELAKAQDRTAAQFLRVLMREAVQRQHDALEHDAWFRHEVEQALREADAKDATFISHEEVRADWRRQRAELMKRIGGRLNED